MLGPRSASSSSSHSANPLPDRPKSGGTYRHHAEHRLLRILQGLVSNGVLRDFDTLRRSPLSAPGARRTTGSRARSRSSSWCRRLASSTRSMPWVSTRTSRGLATWLAARAALAVSALGAPERGWAILGDLPRDGMLAPFEPPRYAGQWSRRARAQAHEVPRA